MTGGFLFVFAAGWATGLLWLHRYELAEWFWRQLDNMEALDDEPVVAEPRPCVRLVWSAKRGDDGPGGEAA